MSALCVEERLYRFLFFFSLYVFVCVRVRRARATVCGDEGVPVGPQGAV